MASSNLETTDLERIERLTIVYEDAAYDIMEMTSLRVEGVVQPPTLQSRLLKLEDIYKTFLDSLLEVIYISQKLDKDTTHLQTLKSDMKGVYYELLSLKRPSTHSSTTRRLPPIDLPKFNGNIGEWASFRDTFLSLVGENPDLSSPLKLQYLKTSLKDSALSVISRIKVSDNGYSQAWDALVSKFDNPRLQASHHIENILNFKPAKGGNKPLESFLTEVGKSATSFEKLKLEDPAGFLLFTIAVRHLDPQTRKTFEQQTSINSIPTFQDLKKFIEEQYVASERTVKMSPRQKVLLPAVTSPCFICEAFHRIYDCDVFKSYPIEIRIDKVKRSGRCLNCLASGHSEKQCLSICCRSCNARHHSLLHKSSNAPDVDYPVGSSMSRSIVATTSGQSPAGRKHSTGHSLLHTSSNSHDVYHRVGSSMSRSNVATTSGQSPAGREHSTGRSLSILRDLGILGITIIRIKDVLLMVHELLQQFFRNFNENNGPNYP